MLPCGCWQGTIGIEHRDMLFYVYIRYRKYHLRSTFSMNVVARP